LNVHNNKKSNTVLIIDLPPQGAFCQPVLAVKYTPRGRASGPELSVEGQARWWSSPGTTI
jgi:hypothetical protein